MSDEKKRPDPTLAKGEPIRDEEVVRRFNDCINARDIDGLASFMTEDHTFIDSANGTVRGKDAALSAWQGFFNSFPDYRNELEQLRLAADRVIVVGHSTCSHPLLAGPALWTARVCNGRVDEWRVYDDVPDNRKRLGLETPRD